MEEHGVIRRLDCKQTVSGAKKYNVKRHYLIHAKNYEKVITKSPRSMLVQQLTEKVTAQKKKTVSNFLKC